MTAEIIDDDGLIESKNNKKGIPAEDAETIVNFFIFVESVEFFL